MSSDSPSKRLKFGESNPLLSSTLLNETKTIDESRAESLNGDSNCVLDKSSLLVREKSAVEQEVTTSKVAVDSPPPTPPIKVTSRLQILTKQQLCLAEESDKLDSLLQTKLKAIDDCQRDIELLRASRFKFEDFASMIGQGQNEIRDYLNLIFSPGNMMGQKFEPLYEELSSKHARKQEKLTLEWNCYIDQVKSFVTKRTEELKHEMELHQRTLLHQEHLSKIQEDSQVLDRNEHEIKTSERDQSCPEIEQGENQETEDCIIIDNSDDAIVDHEETVAERSAEMPVLKQEVDDDETDVEDINGEDSRSFTPCQAQRAEQLSHHD